MKLKQLVKLLQSKNQNEEVEFVVVSKEGAIVCMKMENQAQKLVKVLQLFPSGEKK